MPLLIICGAFPIIFFLSLLRYNFTPPPLPNGTHYSQQNITQFPAMEVNSNLPFKQGCLIVIVMLCYAALTDACCPVPAFRQGTFCNFHKVGAGLTLSPKGSPKSELIYIV